MNEKNLRLIISQYIARFPAMNRTDVKDPREYFKWQSAKRFAPMMEDALAAPDALLPAKLQAAQPLTRTLIDATLQPVQGLVQVSKADPAAVRRLYQALFQSSRLDISLKKEALLSFMRESNQLFAREFPESWRYKTDLASAMGILFLYDPDHNYMYKPNVCRAFADCLELYNDWGCGESTNIAVFERMCDQVAAFLRSDEEILATDALRTRIDKDGLHPDTQKHILLYDLIYCSRTYHFLDQIPYVSPKSKERDKMKEYRDKALLCLAAHEQAQARYTALTAAKETAASLMKPGISIHHKTFGDGTLAQYTSGRATVVFETSGTKLLSLAKSVEQHFLSLPDAHDQAALFDACCVLNQENAIQAALARTEKDLAQWSEYLD